MKFNVRFDRASVAPRHIETIFKLEEVNAHISNGRVVIFEPIQLNERLYREGFIFKNYMNGHCRFAESRHFPVQHGDLVELTEDNWEQILPVKIYARKRSLNFDWAAYVLPIDPHVGETFYVEDLIEDILISEFWAEKIYAVDGIANWDGKGLEFRRDLYDSSECMIVG
ncbi:hypothetical protein N8559_05520 [Gammaproteobacteria bacterium]|nr:hypothetical protein [Gammaproteobacteria bacterium]